MSNLGLPVKETLKYRSRISYRREDANQNKLSSVKLLNWVFIMKKMMDFWDHVLCYWNCAGLRHHGRKT